MRSPVGSPAIWLQRQHPLSLTFPESSYFPLKKSGRFPLLGRRFGRRGATDSGVDGVIMVVDGVGASAGGRGAADAGRAGQLVGGGPPGGGAPASGGVGAGRRAAR